MWKNVFIEACILSALIFGGFYLSASSMKEDISAAGKKINSENTPATELHISGQTYKVDPRSREWSHISGSRFAKTAKKTKPEK